MNPKRFRNALHTIEAAFCDVVIWGILSIFQASGKYLFSVIRSLKINNLMLSVLQLLQQNGLFISVNLLKVIFTTSLLIELFLVIVIICFCHQIGIV
jgi:hypothetical protein